MFSSGGITVFISTTFLFIQFVSHACFKISMYYLNNNIPFFLKDHVSDTSEKILLKQYEKLILIKICYLYTINEITPTLLGKKKHNAPYHPTHNTDTHTHFLTLLCRLPHCFQNHHSKRYHPRMPAPNSLPFTI